MPDDHRHRAAPDRRGSVRPQSLLDRAAARGGPLAGALEDYLTSSGLVLRPDHDERRAAARRQRRLDAIPAAFLPAVIAFTDHELAGQRRARGAGTRPPGHATIEAHLTAVRDLARYLTASTTVTSWAAVSSGDVEAFLAARPATAGSRLGGLRRFFRFAARKRMILADPARDITITRPQGFTGTTLTLHRQRELFGRWTSGTAGVHPHEALTGLLALIHGATTQEIRHLTIDAVSPAAQAVTLGSRPQPTPLDPWTWAAIDACLARHRAARSANPHLLVTSRTKATRAAVSDGYVKNTLRAEGIRPRVLRSSRILALVAAADAKLIATAYGMTYGAVLHYLADDVTLTRLPPNQ